MEIKISKVAGRALRRCNKRDLIIRKIHQLASDPASLAANVVVMQGRPGSRLRVQDWRVVFWIEDDVLHIDEIEPRGSIYEDRT